MSGFEARARELGIDIPTLPPPAASYVPAVRTGNLVFASGQTPTVDGVLQVQGRVGAEVDLDAAVAAARLAALNCIAELRVAAGSLDRIARIVRVTGYVASAPGFGRQPAVVNGASDLLLAIFGESGRHARSAIGVAELPSGAPVEIEVIAELAPEGDSAGRASVEAPSAAVGRAHRTLGSPDERIDARFKGFAAATFGRTMAALAEERPGLFGGSFLPPVMVLREAALYGNIAAMARYVADSGVEHAPHGKTTLAPRLFDLQLEAGAWGISVATPSQAVQCRAMGLDRVFLANELVDPAAIAWLGNELRSDPAFEFLCYVDSLDGVALLRAHLGPGGSGWPDGLVEQGAAAFGERLSLLVELGPVGGRTGCRTVEEAVEVARAARSAGLPIAGVAGYEGGIGARIDDEVLARVRAYLGLLRSAADALMAAGLVRDPRRPIVSAGGSVFFDEVVRAFDAPLASGVRARTIIRPGAYVSHDSGHYAPLSPFTRPGGLTQYRLRPAIEVWGHVLSVPEPGLAIAGVGRRDVPFDLGLPPVLGLRRPGEPANRPATGMEVAGLNDQHAFVRLPAGADVRAGDWIAFGISHPCTAFDKWHLLPVVDAEDRVVDLVRTYF